MKNKKNIMMIMLLVIISLNISAQQNDSLYSYTYNCDGCGTFKTFSVSPVDSVTDVTITTEVLQDTGTNVAAQFSSAQLRKLSPSIFTANDNVKNDLSLYPNPTKGNVMVTLKKAFSSESTVEFIEPATGRILLTDQLNKNQMQKKYSLSQLSPGFYLCRVFNDNKLIGIEKLVKL